MGCFTLWAELRLDCLLPRNGDGDLAQLIISIKQGALGLRCFTLWAELRLDCLLPRNGDGDLAQLITRLK